MQSTLYYDGSCPLCSKEIQFLQKHASDDLEFIDIQTLDDTRSDLPSREALLRRLHLDLGHQQWLTGLDATVHAWSYVPYGKAMKCLRWPGIRQLSDYIYAKWADKRYEKRIKCSESCV